jgi:hypothetical protein
MGAPPNPTLDSIREALYSSSSMGLPRVVPVPRGRLPRFMMDPIPQAATGRNPPKGPSIAVFLAAVILTLTSMGQAAGTAPKSRPATWLTVREATNRATLTRLCGVDENGRDFLLRDRRASDRTPADAAARYRSD